MKSRLGKGRHSAVEISGYVRVHATDIQMSGLHAQAELVLVPTFAPPLHFELRVYETLPNVLNLIAGSANALYRVKENTDQTVVVQDTDGDHSITIEHP